MHEQNPQTTLTPYHVANRHLYSTPVVQAKRTVSVLELAKAAAAQGKPCTPAGFSKGKGVDGGNKAGKERKVSAVRNIPQHTAIG